MSKPIEYICILSGHSAIVQRKDKPEFATEGRDEAAAMKLMRLVDPDASMLAEPFINDPK